MIDRRSLLGVGAAAVTATAFPTTAATATRLRLWPGEAPGGGGPTGPDRIDDKGGVSNIAVPWLEVHTPARPNGAAMLVAGGGGYKRIEVDKEARAAAAWLTERGITAFVLGYRLPIEGWTAGPLAPLQDAQRALRIIRAGAHRYGLVAGRLGVLGFSAGGHLVGMAAGRSAFASYAPADAVDVLPASADLAALAYPVITLMPPYDNTLTRRSLVGAHPTPEESAAWSVETHVRAHYPPTFLIHAQDDPISNPANSFIMADACHRANVPVELHKPATGGHGFAMGKAATATAEWPRLLEAWLKRQAMPSRSLADPAARG